MAGLFRILKDLFTAGGSEPRIPEFIDEPGKGYRGPTPAKAAANAPAVIDPTLVILAPATGRIVSLSQVPDHTFAQRFLGEGLAIEAETGEVCAPVQGQVHLPFKTNHAFVVTTPSGIDVLVHIGLDTTTLPEGTFCPLVQEGDTVNAGQPIIRFSYATVQAVEPSALTCVLVQNVAQHGAILRPIASALSVFAGDDLLSLEMGEL